MPVGSRVWLAQSMHRGCGGYGEQVERRAMQQHWDPIVDNDGRKAVFTTSTSDPNRVEVRLEGGECMTLPRSFIVSSPDGTHRFAQSFASLLELPAGVELTIPVVAEEMDVTKRDVPRERVQVRTTVTQHTERVDVPLTTSDLSVERVKIDLEVESPSVPRQVGDTWIIPVYEEVLHVEKRLVLREEVHVKRVRREVRQPHEVTLRREEVEVVRSKLGDSAAGREPDPG
jgi:uncharacterized protein (TIGR02271 family)